jgi:hypothetical protein
MRTEVRIREIYRRVRNTNPRSGAAFDEVGKPIAWEVVAPSGLVTRYQTEARAEAAAEALRDFYKKWRPCGSFLCWGERYFEAADAAARKAARWEQWYNDHPHLKGRVGK